MGEAATVEEIAVATPGQTVEGYFACVRKEQRRAKNGAPYLSVELRDRSGTIRGRAFRNVDYLASQFDDGDTLWVVANSLKFGDETQLELRTVRKVPPEEMSPLALLPTTFRSIEELDGFFHYLADEVQDRDFQLLLKSVVADGKLMAKFRAVPCTKNGHHAYIGGLLEHTVAVATLAQQLCELHRWLNPDLLLTAALLHDIGKTEEFELGADIRQSEQGRLIGHIQLGQQIVSQRISRNKNFPPDKAAKLIHCIICHHGPQDAGLKEFQSAEALALCRINALDGGVKGFTA